MAGLQLCNLIFKQTSYQSSRFNLLASRNPIHHESWQSIGLAAVATQSRSTMAQLAKGGTATTSDVPCVNSGLSISISVTELLHRARGRISIQQSITSRARLPFLEISGWLGWFLGLRTLLGLDGSLTLTVAL